MNRGTAPARPGAAPEDLLDNKQKGQAIPKAAPKRADNVVDLMSALRASIKGSGKEASSKARPAKKTKPTRRKAS